MTTAITRSNNAAFIAVVIITVSAACLIAISLTVDAGANAKTLAFGISQCILAPFFAGQAALKITKPESSRFGLIAGIFFALATAGSISIITCILMGFRY